ncbi:hypothetical protein SNE40_003701 [Patella caerulea]|uniref:Thioredoxin domain-containing protein 17 n=1 Tax=Patella caerulea TaxID=87958 RepID=A0AAN8QFJ8_PATCE
MVVEIGVEGYDAFQKVAEENKGKVVFALFCGSIDANGQSWCPDCVVAAPVINANLKYAPKDSVLIHCGVGDRQFWKDQNNAFRKDNRLALKSVPTLLKLGQPQRLEEAQCAKPEMVKMLFEDVE